AEPHLIGPEQKQWLDRLETDLPNLREALRFLLEADIDKALQTSVSLWRLFWIRGHLREGQVAIETALERSRDRPIALRARGLTALGSIAYARGEAEQAERHASEALRLFRKMEVDARMLSSLLTLGRLAMDRGDFIAARRYLEEGLEVANS
ncbi:MAG TPA: tetratricopeptide repeat protein, partial [Actinomycetota bacterium]|nr:tetratricopeptide repeat protein [Actinomycetota bacterium]